MTISGTQTFNLEVSDLIEEGYERAGLKLESGYDYRTGKRSIDLLMLEWQNRNIDIWMVEELYWDNQTDGGSSDPLTYALANETSLYEIRTGTVELLDVVIRTGTVPTAGKFGSGWSDSRLNKLPERSYATITDKQARLALPTDVPTSYYVKTHEILDIGSSTNQKMSIEIYPSPSDGLSGRSAGTDYNLVYWRTKRVADTGNPASNTVEVPGQFLPALVSGLAYNIGLKHGEVGARLGALKTDYDEQIMLLGTKASPNNQGETLAPIQQSAAPQQYPVVRGRDGRSRITRSAGKR